jgi:hypothetical protein
MLASFESFLQTSKLRRDDEMGNFDDPDQTRDLSDAVKEGLDVRDVNRLARNYYNRFQEHLPHPKMDEVVEVLSTAWLTGKKTLVFVRRVASVKELEQKLDERYDKWLIPFLRVSLPQEVQGTFDSVVDRYRREKKVVEDARQVRLTAGRESSGDPEDDRGGTDTFFAWFFRGKGPDGVVSGARVAARFIEAGAAYRTFFERNHVAEVLGVEPGQVAEALASATGHSRPELVVEIQRRAASFLSGKASRHPRYSRFVAAQAAALELLTERKGEKSDFARVVFEQAYQGEIQKPPASRAPDVLSSLEERTFFTELLRPEWRALRDDIWPESMVDALSNRFRESGQGATSGEYRSPWPWPHRYLPPDNRACAKP